MKKYRVQAVDVVDVDVEEWSKLTPIGVTVTRIIDSSRTATTVSVDRNLRAIQWSLAIALDYAEAELQH